MQVRGSSRSVTTEARHAADPYTRLGQATARYSDAITVAIETLHHDAVAELDEQADQVVDQLTSCAAWPTLRAHLLHHAAGGASSPLKVLRAAVEVRELGTGVLGCHEGRVYAMAVGAEGLEPPTPSL